jgi:5-formyltetrahydrofolate cyclo-ligase
MIYDKSLLRKKLLLKRKNFYDEKIIFPFNKIINLLNKKFKNKKQTIAGYYPINFEVNVLNFLLKLNSKRIQTCLPIIQKNHKMKFVKWQPDESLYLDNYGIPEPKRNNKRLYPDIILVPLVGYDYKLNRLGYGAGFYDRALKKLSLNKKIITIGIGFSFQKTSRIPINKNDFALDFILNEKELIYKR